MNCRRARKELSPYLDQVLSQRERLELEQHLEDCASCTHILRQLERMHSLVQDMPMEKPRPAFYERLYHQLSQKEKAPREGLFRVRYLWPAFPVPRLARLAATVVILLAVFVSTFFVWKSLSVPEITLRAFDEEYLQSRQMIPLTDELILPVSGERE